MTTPMFDVDDIDLSAIRASLDVEEPTFADADVATTQPVQPPRPIRRRKGRARSNPDDPKWAIIDAQRAAQDAAWANGSSVPTESPITPAPLTKRDEREVATRLSTILTGATGIPAVRVSYLQMTDEEAKAIAEPLASYLVRNQDTIPVAKQVLEQYDLVAIMFGVVAYVVRVYRDRSEAAELAARNVRPSILNVGSTAPDAEEGSEVRQVNRPTASASFRPWAPNDL